MFNTLTEVQKYLKDQQVQAVDLRFCDLWGRQHHLTIPANQFTPDLLEHGIGFDGSSIGLKNVKSGDMVMVPDLGTGFVDPFWEVPTLSFLCTSLNATDYQIFANDPRNLTRKTSTLSAGIDAPFDPSNAQALAVRR